MGTSRQDIPPPSQRSTASATSRRVLLIIVLLVALVLASAIVFDGLSHAGLLSPMATPTVASYLPPGWHLYHDPGGYFTIALPPDWQADRQTGTVTEGSHGVTVQVPTIDTRLGPPNVATPPPTPPTPPALSISIHIELIVSNVERQALLCPIWHPDTTLARLPAERNEGLAPGWLVDTNTATYQIQYLPPNLPAANPPAVLQLAEVIATLRLIPATTLAC